MYTKRSATEKQDKPKLHNIVYRVENLSGDGPFRSKSAVNFLEYSLKQYWVQEMGKVLPHPNKDHCAGPIFESGKHHCGCLSKADLERCFKPKLSELIQQGFQIVKYKVRTSELGRGEHQVWFNRKLATRL